VFRVNSTYNSSQLIENYTLLPLGKIDLIELVEDNQRDVMIYLDKSQPLMATGRNYTITVRDVVAKSGKRITEGIGNTLGFVFYTDSPDDPYVYPNPIKLNEGKDIYFANLPAKAEVVIYSLEMEELNRLLENDGNGGIEWNGLDKKGSQLGSGVYLFKVIQFNPVGNTIESELKKFIIIR